MDTRATIDALGASRREVETSERLLESPKAVYEYIDFFMDWFARVASELEDVLAALPHGPRRRHIDALRQIASNAAVEQRRCLVFRDKWINRPLPYEQVRPLLTRISVDTRDQLVDYRDLTAAAQRFVELAGPDESDDGGMGRRELFTRFLRREDEHS